MQQTSFPCALPLILTALPLSSSEPTVAGTLEECRAAGDFCAKVARELRGDP